MIIFFQVLDAVFVSPGHRGRGYTAQLMERLLSEGKDLCLSYPGRESAPCTSTEQLGYYKVVPRLRELVPHGMKEPGCGIHAT